jgi:lipopolysaccharide biosynthesis regulator YciM
MPTESAFLLAGLLFIAAALGYVFAKFGEIDDEDTPSEQLSADYLKGLNYVLNEQPDRAVELFTRMAELDDEALETHFALGSLFRKRGEVDRAIRVHQNLIARPSLSQAQKDQAAVALAEDYLGAGLYDRAESLFAKLCESPDFRQHSLMRLIRICESTREWDRAIEFHAELERTDPSVSDAPEIAHYYCELAERARAAKDFSTAREMLKKAESGRSRTVRSLFIGANLADDVGKSDEAIRLYRQIIDASPNLLIEVITRLARSCKAADKDDELTTVLRKLMERDEGHGDALAMAAVLDPSIDNSVALDALQNFIASDPTLNGLIDLDSLLEAGVAVRTESLSRIRETLKRIVSAKPRYICEQCGYASLILHWQCPGCRSWETMKPETRIKLG